MEILDNGEDFSPKVSFRRNGSLAYAVPSFLIEGIAKKRISYDPIPEEPLKLSVLKLDGSYFDIEVARDGTVAELKKAVEDAFSHFPKKGPGKVSWSHVWGNFCLSYDGQELLTDSRLLENYGIKDGDELSFIRRFSISCNVVKTCSEREDHDLYRTTISNGFEDRWNERAEDENHRYNNFDNTDEDESDNNEYDNGGVITNWEYKLVHLFRGWWSYRKLASSDDESSEEEME